MSTETLKKYDPWLAEDGPAALVMREYLIPVEGKDAPIFPATFAASEEESAENETARAGYNIDRFDGGSVCLVDSVGSQANRLEAIFKGAKYSHLVPQIRVKVGARIVNLLDAGHRAADAVIRFSALQPTLEEAFRALLEDGNAEPLAKIAPTSVLFGVWDSRATQAKLPRLLSSVIRAYGVLELTRSATFRSAADYVAEGVIKEELDAGSGKKNALSREGMKYALATRTPGGILVNDRVQRDAALSLAGIRCLQGPGEDQTRSLQRYILGLGMCALMASPARELRQGCHLTLDKDRPREVCLVYYDGTRRAEQVTPEAALTFASDAARAFVVGESRETDFDPEHADLWLRLPKEEQKKLARAGNVTKTALKKHLADKKAKKPPTAKA